MPRLAYGDDAINKSEYGMVDNPGRTALMTSTSGFALSPIGQNAVSSHRTASNVLPRGAPILAVCTSTTTPLLSLTVSASSSSIMSANAAIFAHEADDVVLDDLSLIAILRDD